MISFRSLLLCALTLTFMSSCSKDENTSRLSSLSGKLKSVTGPDTLNQVYLSFHYDEAGRVDSMYNNQHYFKFWYTGESEVPYFLSDSTYNLNNNVSTVRKYSIRYDNLNRPVWDSTSSRFYYHNTNQVSETSPLNNVRTYRYENNYRLLIYSPTSNIRDTIFFQSDSSVIRRFLFYTNLSYQKVDYTGPYIQQVNPLWALNIRKSLNELYYVGYGPNNLVWTTKYLPSKISMLNPPTYLIQPNERYEQNRTVELDAQNRIHKEKIISHIYSGNAPYPILSSDTGYLYYNYYP